MVTGKSRIACALIACVLCTGAQSWGQTIERISVDSADMRVGGASGPGGCGFCPQSNAPAATVSANGRFVAFASFDGTLDMGGPAPGANGAPSIYVRDRTLHQTRMISLDANDGVMQGCADA